MILVAARLHYFELAVAALASSSRTTCAASLGRIRRDARLGTAAKAIGIDLRRTSVHLRGQLVHPPASARLVVDGQRRVGRQPFNPVSPLLVRPHRRRISS